MSEDLKEIKRRIYEQDRIEELLEAMGCEYVKVEGQFFTAQLPADFRSKNKRSVQIKRNESLTSYIRSRGFNGDIFGLVSYIMHKKRDHEEIYLDLHDAKMWIIETFGYYDVIDGRFKAQKNEYAGINDWLKQIKKKRNKTLFQSYEPNNPIPESIRKKYFMMPYSAWVEEGIFHDTQIEFETGYDHSTDRVVNLIRNKDGELIGVKGRYIGGDEETLKFKKYLYLERMNKSVELYNLHRALPHILAHKKVLIFEGYKSVMKAHQMGYPYAVSTEGDEITDVQVSLIKEIAHDVEVIFCYDKDQIKIEEEVNEDGEIYMPDYSKRIWEQAQKVTHRHVYTLTDKGDLLGEKDSPVDLGRLVFEQLLQEKAKLPVVNMFADGQSKKKKGIS